MEVKFLAAGKTNEEALSFVCRLSADLVLEVGTNQKIDIRCQNVEEAMEIDKLLWTEPEEAFLPHSLSNNRKESDLIEIGYPGTKFTKINKKILINLNPSLPNQLTNYSKYFQIVVEDESVYRETVAKTWNECKSMDLKPTFIK